MKNPYKMIEKEMTDWLKSRGYSVRYSFGASGIHIVLFQKVSGTDLKEFLNEFNCNLTLGEVVFNEQGEKINFKYFCTPPVFENFISSVKRWLYDHNISFNFLFCSDDISLTCYEELSDSIIEDFEKEFEVKCREYKISCNNKNIEYVFY